jgi:hypothetical protein
MSESVPTYAQPLDAKQQRSVLEINSGAQFRVLRIAANKMILSSTTCRIRHRLNYKYTPLLPPPFPPLPYSFPYLSKDTKCRIGHRMRVLRNSNMCFSSRPGNGIKAIQHRCAEIPARILFLNGLYKPKALEGHYKRNIDV